MTASPAVLWPPSSARVVGPARGMEAGIDTGPSSTGTGGGDAVPAGARASVRTVSAGLAGVGGGAGGDFAPVGDFFVLQKFAHGRQRSEYFRFFWCHVF